MRVIFRDATEADLESVVALLAEDRLGQGRERPDDMAPYAAAFAQIAADPNNALVVGEIEGRIVATYQITLIPNVSLRATKRAQIEGVRVSADLRGQGVGAALISDAEARARAHGATLLQLTMNAERSDSHRFYVANGFAPSHVGFKKPL
jgi:GNAT superfamily N-acetyltransferase